MGERSGDLGGTVPPPLARAGGIRGLPCRLSPKVTLAETLNRFFDGRTACSAATS